MKYKIREIGNETWQITEGEGPGAAYLYLLKGAGRAALIDTGYGTIDLAKIVRELTDAPVMVLLTHGHADHIGGCGFFSDVYMSKKDYTLYQSHSGGELRRIFLADETALCSPKDVSEIRGMQDYFELGDRRISVIETPGHSVGSVAFWDEKNRWLFTGDTCCKADVLLNLEYAASMEEYHDSVKKLLQYDFAAAWPGHHESPVFRDVPEAFAQAAKMLLDGSAAGEEIRHPSGPAKRFAYKEIAIVYR